MSKKDDIEKSYVLKNVRVHTAALDPNRPFQFRKADGKPSGIPYWFISIVVENEKQAALWKKKFLWGDKIKEINGEQVVYIKQRSKTLDDRAIRPPLVVKPDQSELPLKLVQQIGAGSIVNLRFKLRVHGSNPDDPKDVASDLLAVQVMKLVKFKPKADLTGFEDSGEMELEGVEELEEDFDDESDELIEEEEEEIYDDDDDDLILD